MVFKLSKIFDLIKTNKLQEAKNICFDSLNLNNKDPEVLNVYAIVLFQLKEYQEAIENWKKAINLNPQYFHAYTNLGNALSILKKYEEAFEQFDKASKIRPNEISVSKKKAILLKEVKFFDQAIEEWNKILISSPSDINAYIEKAHILFDLNRIDEALLNYAEAYKMNSKHPFLLGHILHSKSKLCDWKDFSKELKELETNTENNNKICTPYFTLTNFDNPYLQKKVSEIWVKEHEIKNFPQPLPKKNMNKKIKIGYYSADFRTHAVGHLLVGTLELHNKSKFETFGFYFGGKLNEKDKLQKRIIDSFDKFINVSHMSNLEISKLSKDLNIDIAVDLMVHTGAINRFGIFVNRAAPIQVNFLGYPGTSGSKAIDYLIADKTIIPEENKKFYSEEIIYLPDTYQPNEKNKKISEKNFSKKELGLPLKGFIFGCFNQHQKITPEIFDIWINILKQNDDCSIWLLENNKISEKNLKLTLSSKGIDPDRLIFAKLLPLEEHLERLKFVDLFLDTFPYNAHTTASDALRMGVPVLTYQGKSFASRVASSLLNAVNLQELITKSYQEYEKMAIKIMNKPEYLNDLKIKLKKNKLESNLFNSDIYTKNIEKIYEHMHQNYFSKT